MAEYADKGDFNYVTAVQKSLANAYVADMAKYASPQETTRILAAWSSVPGQLAKENHKFQYKMIKSGEGLPSMIRRSHGWRLRG